MLAGRRCSIAGGNRVVVALVGLAACLVLAALSWPAIRRAAQRATGASPEPGPAAAAPPLLDLKKPITHADWQRLAGRYRDARFLDAHAQLWNRYKYVGNPMLLANTIAERMTTHGLDLHDAIIRVAEDHNNERY